MAHLHLLGAVDLDLEHDVATRRQIRNRGSVVVAEELGPLEKTTGLSMEFEGVPRGEDVGVITFARSLGPRRPGTTEQQAGSRDINASTMVPLPTPPGPEMMKMRGA